MGESMLRALGVFLFWLMAVAATAQHSFYPTTPYTWDDFRFSPPPVPMPENWNVIDKSDGFGDNHIIFAPNDPSLKSDSWYAQGAFLYYYPFGLPNDDVSTEKAVLSRLKASTASGSGLRLLALAQITDGHAVMYEVITPNGILSRGIGLYTRGPQYPDSGVKAYYFLTAFAPADRYDASEAQSYLAEVTATLTGNRDLHDEILSIGPGTGPCPAVTSLLGARDLRGR